MNPLSQTPIHTNTYVEQEPEDALFKIRVVHLVPLQKKNKSRTRTPNPFLSSSSYKQNPHMQCTDFHVPVPSWAPTLIHNELFDPCQPLFLGVIYATLKTTITATQKSLPPMMTVLFYAF